MRVLLVTGSDEVYFPLLRDLLLSLHQWKRRPFTDIGVLDLGLARDSKEWLAHVARHVVVPRWDLPVSQSLRLKVPAHRAMTARPFIPRYFPGYDIYVWVDADTWVQERFAIESCIAGAAEGRLAAVSHHHSSYRTAADIHAARHRIMESYFGAAAVKQGHWDIYLNSGVLGLKADAPHWESWARHLKAGIENAPSEKICDQSALNHAMWTERLPVTLLPAICNWMCHLAVPRFDAERWKFCEPGGEGRALGIVHLTGQTKRLKLDFGAGNPDSLRYPGERKQAA